MNRLNLVKRLVLLAILCGFFSPITWLAHPQPTYAQADEKQWLLAQVNNLRANLGLHAYVWNNSLAAAAQQQSEYMAATGHISHTQSNGSTPASRASVNGYQGSFVSENIYGGSIARASDAWSFWMNSPVHYAGIAHQRNNEIGVGVASGAYGQFYTLVFGYNSGMNAPPAQPIEGAPDTNNNGDGGNPVVNQPPPPTARPTRRPPTRTPQPTVPSQTPTITWTPTATWTPSFTPTSLPPTQTPLVWSAPTKVLPSETWTSTPTTSPIAVAAAPTESLLENGIGQNDEADAYPNQSASASVDTNEKEQFNIRDLLPVFLIIQAVLLVAGGYLLFFRRNG